MGGGRREGEEQERASGVSEGRGRVEGGGLEWEC